MDNSINSIVNACNENGVIPFFTFTTCTCGCGAIFHIGNEKVLSKQDVVNSLEAAAKQMREERKNVN